MYVVAIIASLYMAHVLVPYVRVVATLVCSQVEKDVCCCC